MSSPEATPFRKGILKGTTYDFSAAGDAIDRHVHSAHSAHVTIIQRGRVRASGPWGSIVLDPAVDGAGMVAFRPGQEHELVALEPGSRVINIVYGSGLGVGRDADV